METHPFFTAEARRRGGKPFYHRERRGKEFIALLKEQGIPFDPKHVFG
jgi:hypothetical protein